MRHRADGAIEFLGAADHQVKMRGLRIELGEIEFVADTSTGRKAASDRGHARTGAGDSRLVAYVVAEGEPPASEPALRQR